MLPEDTIYLPVGGGEATVESLKPLLEIGAKGFGLGASLYLPTMSDENVRVNAKAFVTALSEAII
ncbi:MAG: hypothetical protein V5786_02215 [Psychromonas sp.]